MTDEPAWCEPARARIDDLNRDIRYAITAERQRIRQLALAEAVRREDAGVFWEIAAVAKRALETFASLIGDPA